MNVEIEAINRKDTWELTKLLENGKIIGMKLVLQDQI